MIFLALALSAAAAISWHPGLYPDSQHGLFFGEGFFAGLTAAATTAWIATVAAGVFG